LSQVLENAGKGGKLKTLIYFQGGEGFFTSHFFYCGGGKGGAKRSQRKKRSEEQVED